MHDILYLSFDLEGLDPKEIDAAYELSDKLLEKQDWIYTGIRNMYRPVRGTDGDSTFWMARNAVLDAEELKPFSPHISFGTCTDVCSLDEIIAPKNFDDKSGKLERYKGYYRKKQEFAHGIIVDEDNVLRDGFSTYIIAKQASEKNIPDIMLVRREQSFWKVVIGRHIQKLGKGFTCWTTKQYIWCYSLKEAVIPGDILVAETVNGCKLMCVEKIRYAVGPCEYKHIIAHSGKNIDIEKAIPYWEPTLCH